MTNKQMTIDGVNVSGCECFYINGSHPERKECINPYCKGLCKGDPNCHYKQLKRAENQIVDLNKMVEAKEQECEIWKNQVLAIDDEAITIQITQQQFEEYNQFKQTLDEIKEIANYSFNRSTSEYMAKLELISEKINEVQR